MAAINHMITIPKEQEDFLNDNPDISLSKITQNSIAEHIEMRKISAETLRETQRKLEAWKVIADKLRSFIEKKGLFDEYLKENV